MVGSATSELIESGVGFPSMEVTRVSKVRILMAEDTDVWREFVSTILRNEPSFEIICEVVDGPQAVLMAERLQPTILLLDIGLPELNGIDVAGRIRNLALKTRIVFLSEQRDVEIVQAALDVSCGYVLKSDAAKDLVAAIHSAIAGEAFISRQLAGLGLAGDCQ
jgi:DNA-binding NarL/FixJ family response regulator